MMSYIDLINGFERVCESEALPAASQLLWYKLIYLSNRRGWPEWVQVDNMRLMSVAGIRDEKTLIRSRNKLIELGLFEYKPGKKGCPGKYRIKEETFTGIFPVNMTGNMPVKTPVNMPVKTPVETPDIIRYKTKTKTKKSISKDIPEKSAVEPDDTVLEAFAEFETYRSEMGKPLTDRARQMAMNKLLELSDDNSERAAIIQQTIICGWSGFYPLKQQRSDDTGKKKKAANKFGQFHQREYDHSELEKQLIRQRCASSAGGDENNE